MTVAPVPTYPNAARTKYTDRVFPSHQSQPITKISVISGSDNQTSVLL